MQSTLSSKLLTVTSLQLLLASAVFVSGCSLLDILEVSPIPKDKAALPPTPSCETGETTSCYTGPDGTQDVGSCGGGVRSCVDGRWSESCDGEFIPQAHDLCDPVAGYSDDNCDGSLCGETEFGFVIGGKGTQEVQDIATDSQGNIFMVGRFSDTLEIPGLDTPLLQEPGTALNMFIVKLSPEGQHLWHRTYGYKDPQFPQTGTANSDWLMNFCHYGTEPFERPSCQLAVDSQDNLIVTGPIPPDLHKFEGHFYWHWKVGSYDFDGGPAGGPSPTPGVAFVAKFKGDSQGVGELLWSETFQGIVRSDRITSVAVVGENDDIVLAGSYTNRKQDDLAEPHSPSDFGYFYGKGCTSDCTTLAYRQEDLFNSDGQAKDSGNVNGFVLALDSTSRDVLWRASIDERDLVPIRQRVVSLTVDDAGLVSLAVTNGDYNQEAPRLSLVFSHSDQETTSIELNNTGGDNSMSILKLNPNDHLNPLAWLSSFRDSNITNWQEDAMFLANLNDQDKTMLVAGGFASDFEAGDSPPLLMSSNNGSYDSFLIAADGRLNPKHGRSDGATTIDETTAAFTTHGESTAYQLISHMHKDGWAALPGQHIDFGQGVSCQTDERHSHCLVRWRWSASEAKLEPVWARAIAATGLVEHVGTLDGDGQMTQLKSVLNKGRGHTALTTNHRGSVLMAANFQGKLLSPFHHEQIVSADDNSPEATSLSNPSDESDIYVLRYAP